jgi:hypothetical protein
MATKKKPKKAPAPKKLKTMDAAEKTSIKTRTDCSTLVGNKGPQCPIWTTIGAVADAGKKLVAAGAALDTADQTAIQADAAALAAHTARDVAQVQWDASYDVYAANVAMYAPTPGDVTALGLGIQIRAVHTLMIPLGISATFDAATGAVLIHVKPAAGLKSVLVEYTTTPNDPASWKRAKGDGLKRKLTGLPPGVYWVRASSVRAAEESDPTTAVAVTVK